MKKIPLIVKILLGFVLGTAAGLLTARLASSELTNSLISFISPFGDVLVAMLKMVVYPIILFSLMYGAASMPLGSSGRVGMLVTIWYAATSLFATVFGVAMAFLMNPTMSSGAEKIAAGNASAVSAMTTSTEAKTLTDFLLGLFENPFAALAEGKFLPIIVFAIMFGLCARYILDNASTNEKIKKNVQLVIDFCDGAQQVSFKIIDCIVAYFPYGIFALSFANFARNGVLLFGPYARITLCVIVCVFLMITLVYPIAVAIFCRENPYKVLAKFRQPMLTAFVTRSSAATLPMSFLACDNAGIDRKLSSFSLPMGATVNMDGVCVHLPVFVILAANMFGHELTLLQVGTLCVSIMFASIGAGGIPGGSVFLLFMVLEAMGLPSEQVTFIVALALGINPILDMFETACNVTGCNICTYIVSRMTKDNKVTS